MASDTPSRSANLGRLGQVLAFESPLDHLTGQHVSLRYGVTWRHEMQSPEVRSLTPYAFRAWVAIRVLADDKTMQCTAGRTVIGDIAGILNWGGELPASHPQHTGADRVRRDPGTVNLGNVRRALLELQAKGLLDIEVQRKRTAAGNYRYEDSRLTLLCPPSCIGEGRQLGLPGLKVRSFSREDHREFRARRRRQAAVS